MRLAQFKIRAFMHQLLATASLLLASCSSHYHKDIKPTLQRLSQSKPRYCAVDKGQIEYYRVGTGTPIVLIAGYITDVSSWNSYFLAELARQHEVIVFNNRNVGKSIVASSQYTTKALAKDTYQLIEKLKLKKPAVVGISMGGMIAQQLAVDYPDKVGQLILINTALPGKQAVHPDQATEKLMLNLPTNKYALGIVVLNQFFPPDWRWYVAKSVITERFQPKEYTEVDIAQVMPQQQELLMDWMNNDKTAKKLTQLKMPVLVLNGVADNVIPPINSDILTATIPTAELKRWQDGGHAMTFQYPRELAQAINRFLSKTHLH